MALGMIGLVMDRAFKDKTLNLVEERLESYVLALLASVQEQEGVFIFPETFPSPRMQQPGSGMYAQIIIEGQTWKTPSLLGHDLPEASMIGPGQKAFNAPLDYDKERIFRMREGFAWDSPNGPIPMTISVSENAENFFRELSEFKENLWVWLLVTSLILLAIQWLIMNWATYPLKRLTSDLGTLEKGDREIFAEDYPPELRGLTINMNRLIENERQNLSRQRRTLGDLAHSLKTPLAVIQSTLESDELDTQVIGQQVHNMNDIVAYQLKRAAVAGRRTFTIGIPVIDDLEKIIGTLKKVHHRRHIETHLQVAPGAEFFGERGDLMELLGNLLENAFKWCDQHVSILIKTLYMEGRKRTGLIIEIADDGPGIPEEKREELLMRGVRGDEKVKGHGIGLSIVSDIVESYQGICEIDEHPVLKGAHFKITIPP